MEVPKVAKGQQDGTLILLHEGLVNGYLKDQERQKTFLGVALDARTPNAPKGFAAA